MGNCIICGVSCEGLVCSTHEEDVAFEFEGNHPNQLTPGRYYRGTVDGFAEFGVFIDIGDAVTGLLHSSEIDQRLESLDWDAGDDVYVQVTNVRDNGNIDLGWSIRQSKAEFRGALVDTPEGDQLDDESEQAAEETADSATEHSDEQTATDEETTASESEPSPDEDATSDSETTVQKTTANGGATTGELRQQEGERSASAGTVGESTTDVVLDRTEIGSLETEVGELVRVEGEVAGIRQTSGPTIFELRDETGTIECAAFDGAGVRAFPEVDIGDHVRLDGEVESRREELQVETESLLVLDGEEREAVASRIEAAIEEEVRPDSVDLLVDDDTLGAVQDEIEAAATAVRRAVKEARPVVVRHSATADGYAAGAALERAVLPMLREEHGRSDAEYHYFDRRPTDSLVYDMESATGDVTDMLESRERHGEQLPLVVLVDLGATTDSSDAYELLDVYDVDRLVIDDTVPDSAVTDSVDPMVAPESSPQDVSSAALASAVAATVNNDVSDDLRHIPAVGFADVPPQVYADTAATAGLDADDITQLREALALEAHYQSYNDKRQLVTDLLFERADGLAGHISEQFRSKLETELDTALENATQREAVGVQFQVLDADAFTNRFDFPPTQLLAEALHRQTSDAEPFVTLVIGEDELYVRSTDYLDVREIVEDVPNSLQGVTAVGGADGRIEFLVGQRDDVLDAVVAAIAARIGE